MIFYEDILRLTDCHNGISSGLESCDLPNDCCGSVEGLLMRKMCGLRRIIVYVVNGDRYAV